ncbi:diacylglycerol kinase epsilon [Bacillus rossius redtenbacheri]|uniref:diacylglycerol kinase epsilon n=1 Tax=Bacillus rossius redtenbacheri TaxID=93214 RepID=UPI002FDD9227
MWPLFAMWNAGLTSVIVPTLAAVSLFATAVFLVRQLTREVHIPIRDATKQHNWLSARLLEKALYCSICESLMMAGDGVFCDCCGVCADSGCIRTADRKLRCKMIAGVDKGRWKHHWVKGNLSLGAVCEVCEDECGSEPGLVDYQCCWCQRTVHSACHQSLGEVCDFGPFRNFIIPPSCVTLKKLSRMRSKLQLRSVTSPNWENWNPIIVLANRKSGSGDGERVLSRFRGQLNPAQVVDLADRPPEAALEWCTLLGDVQTTILVAGGDGTVGWVLTAIHNLNIQPVPRVAIIPLGTGNDLSRVLGWGADYSPESDPSVVLKKVMSAYPVFLDRWNVEMRSHRHIRFRREPHQLFMYNYISFGVDAQVALDFHRARESRFYVFSNRLFNKMLYLLYGTQQVVGRGCQGLERRLEVRLDGRRVELPSVESVVVLNIPSWGGGVRLWGLLDDPPAPQQVGDGRLEVLALFSSMHIGQLQVGLSRPHVVGQACRVQIKLKAKTPVEVDGEPWVQHPADISITCCNQAVMLQCDS